MKTGDRVIVKATGETGQLISTAQYNAMSGGRLQPARWRWTRWVRFDRAAPHRPIVVGHSPSELRKAN